MDTDRSYHSDEKDFIEVDIPMDEDAPSKMRHGGVRAL
jgi:hypothetical protein